MMTLVIKTLLKNQFAKKKKKTLIVFIDAFSQVIRKHINKLQAGAGSWSDQVSVQSKCPFIVALKKSF